MPVNIEELRALSPQEKLQIVELLWDDLGSADQSIPLPEWIGIEVQRRRGELSENPDIGVSHAEMWKRIRRPNV